MRRIKPTDLPSLLRVLKSGGIRVDTEQLENRKTVRVWPFGAEVCSINLEEVDEDRITVWIWIRTTSWDFDGERSDIHDLLSIAILICVYTLSDLSPTVTTIPHPAIETAGEIYARMFTFERDGLFGCRVDRFVIDKLEHLIVACVFARAYLCAALPGPHLPNWAAARPLAEKLCGLLGKSVDERQINFSSRKTPVWSWFNDESTGVAVLCAKGIGMRGSLLTKQLSKRVEMLDGPNACILIRGKRRHAVPHSKRDLARRLFAEIGDPCPDSMPFFLAENCFVAASEDSLILMGHDCSELAVQREVEQIRNRQIVERHTLFKPQLVTWRKKLNDERFEALIHALLVVEPGVTNVRRMGKSRGADGGRDIEADWLIRAPRAPKSERESPYVSSKVIVQCKASGSTVGKNQVRDIRDTIEHHDASGYLLVVSTACSAPLIAHLAKLRQSFWVQWWTCDELDFRLRQHPEIAARFPDLVEISDGW